MIENMKPNDHHNAKLLSHVHPADWRNPTPSPKYNLVVIGAGSAGLISAIAAAGLGGKVALIEKHLMGGDCLNSGCVPSKTLIRSAKVLGEFGRAAALGVNVVAPQVDFAAVMQRVRQVRADISHHDSAQRFSSLGVDVFFGQGQFCAANTVEVLSDNGERVKLNFKKAIIATGSRPLILPIPGLHEAGFLTNETIFQLTEQPARLAVIGAGPIGCELAQAFQRLGSAVHLFSISPQVLPREEPAAAEIVQQALLRDGVTLALGSNIERISSSASGKTLHYRGPNGAHSVEVDAILLAVGRVPNVEQLGLDKVGVKSDKTGVVVDDYLQTSNRDILAAGDVCVATKFTHVADFSARIALQNALFSPLGLGRRKLSSLVVPWCTYTDPEVAHVGMYAHEAEQRGIAYDRFEIRLNAVDRALADGDNDGYVAVLTHKGSDVILGATVVGRHAGELISEITLAMTNKLGLKAIAATIHPYPTQAEAVRKAADAWNRTRLTPLAKNVLGRWLAWSRR